MTSDVVLAALSMAALAAAGHAVFIAPRRLRLIEVNAPIRGLSAGLEGYTIGVLADIHHASPITRSNARHAVEIINASRPDLVVLLGDFGISFKYSRALSRYCYRRMFPSLAPILRRIIARDGVLTVLGNHDYYYDGPAVADWLRSLDIRVLMNEHVMVQRGTARLAIGGVDDVKEGQVDPAGGCAGVPVEVPRIILCHNPDSVLEFAPEARIDLVLSGHTHGGQVVLPLYGAPLRFCHICGRHTACGWVPNTRAPLYVSCGTGSQVPLRFACPPEVVLVRLTSGAGDRAQGTRDRRGERELGRTPE